MWPTGHFVFFFCFLVVDSGTTYRWPLLWIMVSKVKKEDIHTSVLYFFWLAIIRLVNIAVRPQIKQPSRRMLVQTAVYFGCLFLSLCRTTYGSFPLWIMVKKSQERRCTCECAPYFFLFVATAIIVMSSWFINFCMHLCIL